ncbi:unnamed protein product, partial [Owenia fusiformis]
DFKMADINRAHSPMNIYNEDLSLTKDQLEEKKRRLRDRQRAKSPFLIGSIDDVNKKISHLDRRLQSYTELVVESRASETEDFKVYVPPPSAKGRAVHMKRECENKEINRFSGLFSMQAILAPNESERVKNISKISVQPSKSSSKSVNNKDKGKPKFVELHQFPGYDPTELTPLPNDIPTEDILGKVSEAQPKLKSKPNYKPEFNRLFYSQMSQAVLQDTFWWFFLEKFQTSKHNQVKLFNRIAHNYVKLLTYAKEPKYRDVFLRDYPDILAQAVYVAFCESFPDSFRQFNDDFKEDLAGLCGEWVAGVKPYPRSYMKWNLEKLEPEHIKTREEIMKSKRKAKQKKKASLLNFDFLDNLIEPSGTSIDVSESKTSSASLLKSNSAASQNRISRKNSRSSKIDVISEVGNAQTQQPSSSSSSHVQRSRTNEMDGLSPIKEHESVAEVSPRVEKGSKVHKVKSKGMTVSHVNMTDAQDKDEIESHPCCKGPDYIRTIFNIHGQSPLVAHFLRMKNLIDDAGTHVKVQRTIVENLPPLNTPTYRDIMKESYKNVRHIEKQHQSLIETGNKQNAKFVSTQRASLREHQRRQAALLENRGEVKRLSNLLILEQRKDADSVKAGADAAIEAALVAADV